MKKLLLSLFIFILLGFFLLPINDTEARSGCCSWHGGVCGCQCCDGTPLSSTCLPYYPECSGGSLYDFPSYDYTPNIPNCPLNSYYDTLTDSCQCYSGYIVSEGKCISAERWCQDKYGLWATHDYLTDSCKCMSGYVFGKDFLGETTCISADQYCRDLYGFNARHNILTDNCECSYGYVMSGNRCVYGNNYCQDKYGYYSSYDSLSKSCECDYGYKLINGECAKPEPTIYSFYPTTVKAGEKVSISGNNFGDYKGDIILNTLSFGTFGRISSLNIKSWNNNQIKFIVPEDKEPDQYYIRIRPSLIFSSEEGVSEKKLEVLMPLPEISSIFPLSVKVEEKVTIRGENFGTSKRGDLKLYIGSIKVSPFNITSWWDNKIVFEVTEDLESGYIILKDDNFSNPTFVQGFYLEISEPEKDYVPPYFFMPSPESQHKVKLQPELKQETQPELQSLIEESQPFEEPESKFGIQPKLESQPSEKTQPELQSLIEESQPFEEPESKFGIQPKLESQPSEKTQPELQSLIEESQPPEFQEPKEEEQQWSGNIVISDEQEQAEGQKKSIRVFLANILTAVQNFFGQLLR